MVPSGMVTFLFTDIEGSTRRWERDREAMRDAVARHDALMRAAIGERRGHVFKTIGDAFCASFHSVPEAVLAAVAAQRSLAEGDFSAVNGLRVRMALHTGTADERDGDYFGPAVNRVARLLAAGAGGQVLVTGTTAELMRDTPVDGVTLRDLGVHRLKDLDEPERICELRADGLAADFPPLRSLDAEEIRPTPNFTGRAAELDLLATALAGENAVVVVHGLGGTGKSSLAREFAWRNRGRYALTWWLNAQTENGIIDGFLRLGGLFLKGLDRLPDRREAALQVVRTAFADLGRPALLVFDNLEDEDVLRAWRPPSGVQVLATSRDAAWRGDVETIALHPWSAGEATAYLARESARKDLTEADARLLAEALGDLPLAVAHAAAYLRATRTVTPQRYLERISAQLASAPRHAEYPRSVFATFQAAIAAAEQQAPGAAALLCLAAWFAPEAIPDELFRQPAERCANGLQPTLDDAGSGLDLRAALSDAMRADEALGALDRLSLLTFSEATQSYRLHRLVQLATRDLVSDEARAWAESAVAVTDAAFPDVSFEVWARCERFLPHGLAALQALPTGAGDAAAARLANESGSYLRERGAYAEAETLLARALAIRERTLGPDHHEYAVTLNNLAGVMWHQGRYAEAERLFVRALDVLERALGSDHHDVASGRNNLGIVYAELGRYADAEALHVKALESQERTLGRDHPDIAHSLTNLALMYRQQGRGAEAEPLFVRALAIREAALGPDHPYVAYSLNGLAALYQTLERPTDAEPLHARSLAIWERALGPDHPDVASSLNSLALVRWNLGRYVQAERLHLRALAIREKALGPDHPHVANTLNNLACVYRDQERYGEAEVLFARALTIREKALGSEHPETEDTRRKLAALNARRPEA